jgi:hypothetical protein
MEQMNNSIYKCEKLISDRYANYQDSTPSPSERRSQDLDSGLSDSTILSSQWH